jgi:hypothetical protein
VRDAFLQRRLYLVYDGNPPEQLLDDPLEGFEDDEDLPDDAPQEVESDAVDAEEPPSAQSAG